MNFWDDRGRFFKLIVQDGSEDLISQLEVHELVFVSFDVHDHELAIRVGHLAVGLGIGVSLTILFVDFGPKSLFDSNVILDHRCGDLVEC